jgi:hypothetical protein
MLQGPGHWESWHLGCRKSPKRSRGREAGTCFLLCGQGGSGNGKLSLVLLASPQESEPRGHINCFSQGRAMGIKAGEGDRVWGYRLDLANSYWSPAPRRLVCIPRLWGNSLTKERVGKGCWNGCFSDEVFLRLLREPGGIRIPRAVRATDSYLYR